MVVLRQVFRVLDSNGLTLNFGKYDFLKEEITFLGHRVSAAGVTPLGGHVDAIRSVPQPTTPKELQCFLGMVNFYRCSCLPPPTCSNPSRSASKVIPRC